MAAVQMMSHASPEHEMTDPVQDFGFKSRALSPKPADGFALLSSHLDGPTDIEIDQDDHDEAMEDDEQPADAAAAEIAMLDDRPGPDDAVGDLDHEMAEEVAEQMEPLVVDAGTEVSAGKKQDEEPVEESHLLPETTETDAPVVRLPHATDSGAAHKESEGTNEHGVTPVSGAVPATETSSSIEPRRNHEGLEEVTTRNVGGYGYEATEEDISFVCSTMAVYEGDRLHLFAGAPNSDGRFFIEDLSLLHQSFDNLLQAVHESIETMMTEDECIEVEFEDIGLILAEGDAASKTVTPAEILSLHRRLHLQDLERSVSEPCLVTIRHRWSFAHRLEILREAAEAGEPLDEVHVRRHANASNHPPRASEWQLRHSSASPHSQEEEEEEEEVVNLEDDERESPFEAYGGSEGSANDSPEDSASRAIRSKQGREKINGSTAADAILLDDDDDDEQNASADRRSERKAATQVQISIEEEQIYYEDDTDDEEAQQSPAQEQFAEPLNDSFVIGEQSIIVVASAEDASPTPVEVQAQRSFSLTQISDDDEITYESDEDEVDASPSASTPLVASFGATPSGLSTKRQREEDADEIAVPPDSNPTTPNKRVKSA